MFHGPTHRGAVAEGSRGLSAAITPESVLKKIPPPRRGGRALRLTRSSGTISGCAPFGGVSGFRLAVRPRPSWHWAACRVSESQWDSPGNFYHLWVMTRTEVQGYRRTGRSATESECKFSGSDRFILRRVRGSPAPHPPPAASRPFPKADCRAWGQRRR